MGTFVSARRWMAKLKRKKDRKQMTEGDVTPDEARTALLAAMASLGGVVKEVLAYDHRKDEFIVLVHFVANNNLVECFVPGDTVVQIVYQTRMFAGQPKGLLRPSDLYEALKAEAAQRA